MIAAKKIDLHFNLLQVYRLLKIIKDEYCNGKCKECPLNWSNKIATTNVSCLVNAIDITRQELDELSEEITQWLREKD